MRQSNFQNFSVNSNIQSRLEYQEKQNKVYLCMKIAGAVLALLMVFIMVKGIFTGDVSEKACSLKGNMKSWLDELKEKAFGKPREDITCSENTCQETKNSN